MAYKDTCCNIRLIYDIKCYMIYINYISIYLEKNTHIMHKKLYFVTYRLKNSVNCERGIAKQIL